MIVLDTSVLSLVFRRPVANRPASGIVSRFRSLVEDGPPLGVPGVVFQELLSGVRDQRQFERLRAAIEGFPLILAEEEDHLEAARLMNLLRRHGIPASSFDVLIAAIAVRRDSVLFTLDRDFSRFADFVPLRLFEAP